MLKVLVVRDVVEYGSLETGGGATSRHNRTATKKSPTAQRVKPNKVRLAEPGGRFVVLGYEDAGLSQPHRPIR